MSGRRDSLLKRAYDGILQYFYPKKEPESQTFTIVASIVAVFSALLFAWIWRTRKYYEKKSATTKTPPAPVKLPDSDDENEEYFASCSDVDETESDELQESPLDYCFGGYHPVQIGHFLHYRYRVIKKLGWGHSSTVWLCWDFELKTFLALKIFKSDQTYTELALDEIGRLRCVLEADPSDHKRKRIVKLIKSFKIMGVNGIHVCMVSELLGPSLRQVIIHKDFKGLRLPIVRVILRQVLEALDYLHSKCHIIHSDLKPENIMLCADKFYIRDITAKTEQWLKMDIKLPDFFVSMDPNQDNAIPDTDSENGFKIRQRADSLPTASMYKNINLTPFEDVSDPPPSAEELSTDSRTLVSKTKDQTRLSTVGQVSKGYKILKKHYITASEERLLNKMSPVPAQIKPKLLGLDYYSDSDINLRLKYNKSNNENDVSEDGSTSYSQYPFHNSILNDILRNKRMRSTGQENKKGVTLNIGEGIRIKIADLGNACFMSHHTNKKIQDRPYRCLEAFLRAHYDTSADIWSTACIAFEMATGKRLFESSNSMDRNKYEDHLARISELLGTIPKQIALSGRDSQLYFKKDGKLRNPSKRKPQGLVEILTQKFEWSHDEAEDFSDFLLPMLALNPKKRATAARCLRHPWLYK